MNPTWKVWIMLTWVIGDVFDMALEGRPDGICDEIWVRACGLQKTLDCGP